MKRFGVFVVAALVFGFAGAARLGATPFNYVQNGTFSSNNLNGGWGLFSNGQVANWTTTDSAGLIELDTAAAIGPGTNPFSTNSLEVNANYPETVQQTLTGLTIGQTYFLSWEYGDRPSSGPQEMQVWLNGVLVTTNIDSGGNSQLVWIGNGFDVTATNSSEVLSFVGVPAGGQPGFGNEITAISLIATPEPSTWILMLTGAGLLGFVMWRKRGLALRSAI